MYANFLVPCFFAPFDQVGVLSPSIFHLHLDPLYRNLPFPIGPVADRHQVLSALLEGAMSLGKGNCHKAKKSWGEQREPWQD